MKDEDDVLSRTVSAAHLPDLNESLALVRRAQQGEAEALNRLLARFQDRLHRIVRIRLGRHLRTRVDSMDIVQETNIAAAKAMGHSDLRSTADIINWLTRIASNKIRDLNDFVQARKRDYRLEVQLAGPGESGERRVDAGNLVASDTRPDERAEKNELVRMVDEVVADLPTDDREVILLRDYYGGSWRFVADAMKQTSEDAARQHHKRAKHRLRCGVRARLAGQVPPRAAI